MFKGESTKFVTVNDAGRMLNLSGSAIRAACDRGEIRCLRASNGTRLIPLEELQRVQQHRAARSADPDATKATGSTLSWTEG